MQPGYPGYQQPPGGYPAQPGGYPPQPGGYPPQAGGYPPQAGGYPPQPGGYPPQGMPPPPPKFTGYSGMPPDTESGAGLMGSPMGDSFSDKAIRRAFIRKVYLILMCQLAVTCGFIALFVFHDGVKSYVRANSWLYWLSYGIFVVVYIALACCSSVRRTFPMNFIFLAIFTVALSYMAGTISSYYDTKIVMIAIGISTLVCFSVSLFAIQTKFDFTKLGGILFVALMVVFFFGLLSLILYRWVPVLQIVYSALIALLFTAFLAYDTQMVMGNKKHSISPEEYIYGAMQIYVDVVYIFLAILSLTGSASN